MAEEGAGLGFASALVTARAAQRGGLADRCVVTLELRNAYITSIVPRDEDRHTPGFSMIIDFRAFDGDLLSLVLGLGHTWKDQ
jgi:hypothetical protein